MGTYLRKYFFAAVGILVAIAAFLNARAVAELVGIALAPDAKALATPPPVRASAFVAPSAAVQARSAEAILDRNPFDHVTGSLRPAPSTTPETPADVASTEDPWSAPICDGVNVLVVVASEDESWSYASLSSGDGKRHLLRKGGELGTRKVHFIGWDRVWLTGEGAMCQALLFGQKKAPLAAPPPPAASAVPAPVTRGAKPLDPELRKGIRQMSATEFAIDRGVVDRILENQSELMRQARIIPEQENGRTVGIRMVGIKPDSLLGVLGMQNGDRLQTINGFDMASPEKALEAYARLRTADKLTVQVNRGGKNMNIDYNIR